MQLYTNDYLEYYLTLVGWIINSGIWEMIGGTGLFAAPFAAIIIRKPLAFRLQRERYNGAFRVASAAPGQIR